MLLSDHSEFLALLAGQNAYDGTVPGYEDKAPKPVFKVPYVLVTAFVPRVGERSLNRTPHSRVTKWRTTITSSNPTSVGIVAKNVAALLEGARIGGRRLEAVTNDLPITEDEDVTLPSSGTHPHYAVLEWHLS